MPGRGTTRPRLAGEDLFGWGALIDGHLAWMRLRGLSANTVYGRGKALVVFRTWIEARAVEPAAVSIDVLDGYHRHLHRHVARDGRPLSVRTVQQYLIAVRQLFVWAVRQRHLPSNPAAELELPQAPDRLPRRVLDVEQAEAVLAQPDLSGSLGRRDRVMLEIFYATGVRRAELASLDIGDVNLGKRSLLVREGKGGRDRVVPLGERCTAWVTSYLTDTRPALTVDVNEPALFLSNAGTRLCLAHVGSLVARYLRAAGIEEGGAHVFRHTVATLMLEGGADVRWVQAMLGHRSIVSTQIYTHVDITALAAVHAATHPGTSNVTRSRRPTQAAQSPSDHLAAVVPLRHRVRPADQG
jgi:integrase/recombinase XerD